MHGYKFSWDKSAQTDIEDTKTSQNNLNLVASVDIESVQYGSAWIVYQCSEPSERETPNNTHQQTNLSHSSRIVIEELNFSIVVLAKE